MARTDVDAWIAEEQGSEVLERVGQVSALETYGRREPMATDTKSVPRSSGVGVAVVAKGGTYGEDTNTDDEVILTSRKFGRVIRIAEEDIDDSPVAIIASKQRDWATSYGKSLDNAAFAVTAAENGTTIPFTSVYNLLNTTDAGLGYTAGDNITQAATLTAPSYDNLSTCLGIYEDGDYFDADNTVVIASPAWKSRLRNIKDDQNMPVFVRGQGENVDMLFDFPVRWSLGLKTSATNTDSPTGNPLLVVSNRDFLIMGVRSGPESVVIDGRDGTSALTDETLLKMRSRRGFAGGHPKAFSLLEDVA